MFVALPAGFGKSYCFALLPTVLDHLRARKEPSIMVCVSPLTALVMDTEKQDLHTNASSSDQELMSRPKGGEGAYNLRISVW